MLDCGALGWALQRMDAPAGRSIRADGKSIRAAATTKRYSETGNPYSVDVFVVEPSEIGYDFVQFETSPQRGHQDQIKDNIIDR